MELTRITLVEGSWYLIHSRDKVLVGQYITTRGNDEEYPTFILHLSTTSYPVSVTRANVIGEMKVVTT